MKIRFFGNSKGVMTSAAAGILSLALLSTSCAQTNSHKPEMPAGSPAPVPVVSNAQINQNNPESPTNASVAVAPALELPADLSPGLAEIIKLAQAKVGDDVILAYIKNTRMRYRPSADEIVYLNDIGISDKVITALLEHGKAMADEAIAQEPAITEEPPPPPAPEPTLTNAPAPSYNVTAETNAVPAAPPAPAPQASVAPPPQQVTVNYFYDSLAPYGVWIDVAGYGRCWRPSVVAVNPGWQPYWDRGRWIYTDSGWYWQSDYSWGWAAFHYGRWHQHHHHGWVWCPDTVWAPAWVCWRNYDTYCGWAPLPPSAHWRVGVGFVFDHGHVGVGFGLGVGVFRFVHYNHLSHHHPYHYGVPHHNAVNIYNRSTVVNNYVVKNTTIINNGVGVDRVSAVTRKPVEKVVLRDVSGAPHMKPAAGVDRVDTKSRTLSVYRPNVAVAAAQAAPVAQRKPVLINKSSAISDPQRKSVVATQNSSAAASRLSGATHVSPAQKTATSAPNISKSATIQKPQITGTPSVAKPATSQTAARQKPSVAQPQLSAPAQRAAKESTPTSATRHPAVTGSTHPAGNIKPTASPARQVQQAPSVAAKTSAPAKTEPSTPKSSSRNVAWPGSNVSQPANSQSARQLQSPAQPIQPRVPQQPAWNTRVQSPRAMSIEKPAAPQVSSQPARSIAPSRPTQSAPAPSIPSSSTRSMSPAPSVRTMEAPSSGRGIGSMRPETGGSSRSGGSFQSNSRLGNERFR